MNKEEIFDKVTTLYREKNKDRIIYPTDIKKYYGCIRNEGLNNYLVVIKHKSLNVSIRGRFPTYEASFQFIKEKNIEYRLPIRNMIINCGIYMKVRLTQGKDMIFDHRHIKLIQKHCLCAVYCKEVQGYYARTIVKGKTIRAHNLIMNHTPSKGRITDHISRRTLDNRVSNLRIVNQAIQSTNRRVGSNNKQGITGVHYAITRKYFVVTGSRKRSPKRISVSKYGYEKAKELAIAYRKKMEATDPLYIEAYNKQKIGIDMNPVDMYNVSDDLEYLNDLSL